jgi:hypothetical protein
MVGYRAAYTINNVAASPPTVPATPANAVYSTVAIGWQALFNVGAGSPTVIGSGNVAIGASAGNAVVAGGMNVIIGTVTGANDINTSGPAGTVIGQSNGNIMIGSVAGPGAAQTQLGNGTGSYNVIIGSINNPGPGNQSTGLVAGSNNLILGSNVVGLTDVSNAVILASGPNPAVPRYDYNYTNAAFSTVRSPLISGYFVVKPAPYAAVTAPYSAAGTPLPACTASLEGAFASVSDAPGRQMPYGTGGGTTRTGVYCAGGATPAWITL